MLICVVNIRDSSYRFLFSWIDVKSFLIKQRRAARMLARMLARMHDTVSHSSWFGWFPDRLISSRHSSMGDIFIGIYISWPLLGRKQNGSLLAELIISPVFQAMPPTKICGVLQVRAVRELCLTAIAWLISIKLANRVDMHPFVGIY